jgi:hypothetical protein
MMTLRVSRSPLLEQLRNKYKFKVYTNNAKATIAILDHSHRHLLRSNMNPYFLKIRLTNFAITLSPAGVSLH